MAANMTVEQLALVPFSFPTYANALGRAAIKAARELDIHTVSAEDTLSEATDAATLATQDTLPRHPPSAHPPGDDAPGRHPRGAGW